MTDDVNLSESQRVYLFDYLALTSGILHLLTPLHCPNPRATLVVTYAAAAATGFRFVGRESALRGSKCSDGTSARFCWLGLDQNRLDHLD